MELRFLGGVQEVGRSAILVDDALLLDFGMTTDSPPQYPIGTGAGGASGSGADAVDPEAVVVTHGHLDHVGALPTLLAGDARPPVHWTPPTRDLALALCRDTLDLHGRSPLCPFTEEDVARLTQVSTTHGYREAFTVAGYEVTLFPAGHIPGSAHVLVDDGETRLLYTGDFATTDQRLVSPSTDRPAADVVVPESTYSDVTHDPREAIEERFVELVRTTRWNGGTVVVPAFAIGRTQELMLVCDAHDVDVYVDGMGVRITRMLREHPNFLRNAEALRGAIANARFLERGTGTDRRRRIAEQGSVVITTAGMLGGGPAMTYVPAVADDPTNAVALTGYQVAGTPGRELLETGRAEFDGRVVPVSAAVEAFDFSAHADREGLDAFLDSYRDARVLVNHGDRCGDYAEELCAEGIDASAPTAGERIVVDAD